ncbi:MAG: glutamine synthetase type III, partial [Oscillospiraceae bacterium]|nr:glutamine synthetase type III [Oscillospiraceae bacterium]
VPHYTDEKNVEIFEEFKVLTRTEIESRKEILLENYSKIINIEALTMVDMARKQIIPAGLEFTKGLAKSIALKSQGGISFKTEKTLAEKASCLTDSILEATDTLDNKLIEVKNCTTVEATARFYRDEVFVAMQSLRAVVDELETIAPENIWPFPTYTELLFGV